SSDQIRKNVVRTDPMPPHVVQPRFDPGLETIILKCLEKDPARRYGSGAAFADDLGRWRRGEPIAARPEGWARKAGRSSRRHRVISAACLLLAAALAATPIARYYSDPERALQGMQRDLSEGKAVTSIPEDGGPRWSRVVYASGPSRMNIEKGKPFSIIAMEGE